MQERPKTINATLPLKKPNWRESPRNVMFLFRISFLKVWTTFCLFSRSSSKTKWRVSSLALQHPCLCAKLQVVLYRFPFTHLPSVVRDRISVSDWIENKESDDWQVSCGRLLQLLIPDTPEKKKTEQLYPGVYTVLWRPHTCSTSWTPQRYWGDACIHPNCGSNADSLNLPSGVAPPMEQASVGTDRWGVKQPWLEPGKSPTSIDYRMSCKEKNVQKAMQKLTLSLWPQTKKSQTCNLCQRIVARTSQLGQAKSGTLYLPVSFPIMKTEIITEPSQSLKSLLEECISEQANNN